MAYNDSDYASLGAALAAAAGDVLLVTQDHSIASTHTIPPHTRLIGWGGSVTATTDADMFHAGGNGVEVEDLRMVGVSSGNAPSNFPLGHTGQAIHFFGVKNAAVRNCRISSFKGVGILLRDCSSYEVSGNLIWGGKYTFGDSSDIAVSSSVSGRGGIIASNRCLSNNSQGIYADPMSHDTEITIVGNLCAAYEDDGLTPAQAGGVRRHGIIGCYVGLGQSRITITGNVCFNTRCSGIYIQGGYDNVLAGKIAVTANVCSHNNYANEFIGGGIFVNVRAGTIVSDNVVLNHQGTNAGAIMLNGPGGSMPQIAQAHGNLVAGAAGTGILIYNNIRGASVKGNVCIDNAGSDIRTELSSDAANGCIEIAGNTCVRTNNSAPAIYYNGVSATRRSIIRDNFIRGSKASLPSTGDAGIQIGWPSLLDVIGNFVENCHVGIDVAQSLHSVGSGGRFFDEFRIDDNRLSNCAQGLGISTYAGNPVLPVEGNAFHDCGLRIGSGTIMGTPCGYEAQRLGTAILLAPRAAAPATGTWAVGDEFKYLAPIGSRGGICTAAGSPGTWKDWGQIAP